MGEYQIEQLEALSLVRLHLKSLPPCERRRRESCVEWLVSGDVCALAGGAKGAQSRRRAVAVINRQFSFAPWAAAVVTALALAWSSTASPSS